MIDIKISMCHPPYHHGLISACSTHIEIGPINEIEEMGLRSRLLLLKVLVGSDVFKADIVVVDGYMFVGVYSDEATRSEQSVDPRSVVSVAQTRGQVVVGQRCEVVSIVASFCAFFLFAHDLMVRAVTGNQGVGLDKRERRRKRKRTSKIKKRGKKKPQGAFFGLLADACCCCCYFFLHTKNGRPRSSRSSSFLPLSK